MCNVSWVYRMKGGARVESCCPALQHKMMTLLGVIRIVRQAGIATNMVAAAQ